MDKQEVGGLILIAALLIVLAFVVGTQVASHQACMSLGYDAGKFDLFEGEPVCEFDALEATIGEWYECYTQNYCPPE